MLYTQPYSSNFCEDSSELKNNIYLLTSLQKNYFGEQSSSPAVSLNVKEISIRDIHTTYFCSPTESAQSLNFKNWLVIPKPESYLTRDELEKELVFVSNSSFLEPNEYLGLELVKKLKKFSQARNVYIHYDKDLTVIKVILDVDHYDCDLMDELFKNVEFPIKDTFEERLFHFDYIPYYPGYEKLINSQRDKLIFNKEIDSKPFVEKKIDFLEFDEYIQPEKYYAKSNYA